MSHIAQARPAPHSVYTTPEFWADPHISASMLAFHLDGVSHASSRPFEFIDRAAEWIVRRFRLAPGVRILDLGCGPGLYAQRLARTGASVTGVDVSPRSLAYAREAAAAESLSIDYVQLNYLEDDLGGPFDLAMMICEDYCALSPDQRHRLLSRVRGVLAPGGAFLFDVSAAPRFEDHTEGIVTEDNLQDGFWAEAPYVGTREDWLYPELRLLLERYTIVTADEERQYYNWTQFLTADEASAEATSAGFEGVEILGDVAGAPFDPRAGTIAVVARNARRVGNPSAG